MCCALIIPRLRGHLGLARHALLGRCCQTNAAVGRRCCSRAQMSRKSSANPAWQQSSFTKRGTLDCFAALDMTIHVSSTMLQRARLKNWRIENDAFSPSFHTNLVNSRKQNEPIWIFCRRYTSRVLITGWDSSVRWTGHLSAMTSNRARCAALRSPVSVTSRDSTSILGLPSPVAAQSSAWHRS